MTLFGFGLKIRVDRGHLILEDGIAEDRREGRFSRVRHGLERLIVIGADGMISLAALRWLADQNASFCMLVRDGPVLAVTGPVRPSDARLRRAQARADLSGAALVIGRELISRKLAGQEHVAREGFRDGSTADKIAEYRTQLTKAAGIPDVRRIEAQAAQLYWSVWSDLPVIFPKADLRRVPAHWQRFDARRSPLTESPIRSANPPNAMLNYLYAILEAESRLALAALGLDPGLGFIHADDERRDNLACDVMEAIRPLCDSLVLDWIRRAPLKREWFLRAARRELPAHGRLRSATLGNRTDVASGCGSARRMGFTNAVVGNSQAHAQAGSRHPVDAESNPRGAPRPIGFACCNSSTARRLLQMWSFYKTRPEILPSLWHCYWNGEC